jgi:hypothetical protein
LFKKGKSTECELKERFFVYCDNRIISFKVRNIFRRITPIPFRTKLTLRKEAY